MKNKLIVCLLCGLMSVSFTAAKKPGFAVWQLCAQGPSQMNSYVFVTDRGRVVVLDGGTAADAPFCGDSWPPWATASTNGSSPIRMWITWGR